MRNFSDILMESQIGYSIMHSSFDEAVNEVINYIKSNNYIIDPNDIKTKIKEVGVNNSDCLYLWKPDRTPARMSIIYMIRKIQENKYELAVYFKPVEIDSYNKTRI